MFLVDFGQVFRNLTNNQVKVIRYLTDNGGYCAGSYGTLARLCNIPDSNPTALRIQLIELEKAGVIKLLIERLDKASHLRACELLPNWEKNLVKNAGMIKTRKIHRGRPRNKTDATQSG